MLDGMGIDTGVDSRCLVASTIIAPSSITRCPESTCSRAREGRQKFGLGSAAQSRVPNEAPSREPLGRSG